MSHKARPCLSALFIALVMLTHLVENKPCRVGLMMCNRRKSGKRFLPRKVSAVNSFTLKGELCFERGSALTETSKDALCPS